MSTSESWHLGSEAAPRLRLPIGGFPFSDLFLTFSKLSIDISKVDVSSCVSHHRNGQLTDKEIRKEPPVIASMFNLDHRLAELRPTEQQERTARALRKAAAPATRPALATGEPARSWLATGGNHLSRPTAG
jgi:hypothetical protein